MALGKNHSERATVRQVASLQVHVETLQARIVAGQDVDGDMLIRLTSEHRRLLLRAATRDEPMARQGLGRIVSGRTAIESTVGARAQARAVTPLVRVPRLQQRSLAHLSS